MTKCKHKGECICGKHPKEESKIVTINGLHYLERTCLETLPKLLSVIEKPKFELSREGDAVTFDCLLNVPYREYDDDGGFKMRYSYKFKTLDSNPDYMQNIIQKISADIALCSCFGKRGLAT